MVWVVEKKVVHHMLGLGFERVDIPIRVKFEFEVEELSCLFPLFRHGLLGYRYQD